MCSLQIFPKHIVSAHPPFPPSVEAWRQKSRGEPGMARHTPELTCLPSTSDELFPVDKAHCCGQKGADVSSWTSVMEVGGSPRHPALSSPRAASF